MRRPLRRNTSFHSISSPSSSSSAGICSILFSPNFGKKLQCNQTIIFHWKNLRVSHIASNNADLILYTHYYREFSQSYSHVHTLDLYLQRTQTRILSEVVNLIKTAPARHKKGNKYLKIQWCILKAGWKITYPDFPL